MPTMKYTYSMYSILYILVHLKCSCICFNSYLIRIPSLKLFTVRAFDRANKSSHMSKSRAGHATTLLRQHDHVFRPQSWWLLHYYYIRHRDLNIFRIFLVPEALLRCREAKTLSRAQLWVEERKWRIKKWIQLTGIYDFQHIVVTF